MTNIVYFYNTIRDDDSVSSTTTEEESPATSRPHQGVVVASSDSVSPVFGLMEISLLEALLNTISRFNHLALCDNIKIEPVHNYYLKIDLILKHFGSVLYALFNSQIASNEQLNKVFEELDMLVNEAWELVKSWHPTTREFYSVMQAESLISRIRSSCLDALKLLNLMHQDLPDPLNSTSVEAGAVRCLVDLQSTSVDLQRAATSELRLLAKHNMDNRIVIAKCGAISLLVGLLHSTDTHIQENAVTALFNLSLHDDNKSAIANADAIDPLIHVLETGSCEAKENSAATLFRLSVIEENRVRIGRSRAIGPLVDLLGNGTPRGKKDAATALFSLSIFHESKARIVQAGAVRYLVELMDPAAGMVDNAVAVLANLATIPEGRGAMARGIPVLVEVVELGSARGKENAAAVLLQLCTNSSRFCSMVLQEGAVPPLVALSQSGTPRAKEKAQALLSYFINQHHGSAGRSAGRG